MYDIATFTANPWAEESVFTRKPLDRTPPPKFADIRARLPAPQWEGHADTIACYWKAWELAFGKLRIPEENIGFVRTEWIDDARFGLFIHFGLYSLPSGVWNGQRMGRNDYAAREKG